MNMNAPLKMIDRALRDLCRDNFDLFVEYTTGAKPDALGFTSRMVCTAAWELGRNPQSRIMYVAETQFWAREVLSHIEDALRSPKVRDVFPALAIVERRPYWLTVRRASACMDPSVRAVGLLGLVAGARVDLLILDAYVGERTEERRWLDQCVLSRATVGRFRKIVR